jgi:RWD domain/Zinc finger, C3HC4 type (RING finger)
MPFASKSQGEARVSKDHFSDDLIVVVSTAPRRVPSLVCASEFRVSHVWCDFTVSSVTRAESIYSRTDFCHCSPSAYHIFYVSVCACQQVSTWCGLAKEVLPPTMTSHQPQLNTELEDEVGALNAIYGDSTLTIASYGESYTTCLLKSEDGPYSWEIRFPASYPSEAPNVVGIDSLWMSIGPKTKQEATRIQRIVEESFTPGQVCMFDVVNMLRVQAKMEVPKDSVEEFVQTSSLSTTSRVPPRQLPDFADLESLTQCGSCLDEYMMVDLAKLPCRHTFCPECVQSMNRPNNRNEHLVNSLYRWFPSLYRFQDLIHLLRKVGASPNPGTILYLPRQNLEMVCRIPP